MKKSIGEEEDNDSSHSQDSITTKKKKGQKKQTAAAQEKQQMQKSLNLQSQITKIIFDYVNLGNVETLRLEQARLGFGQPDDIAYL